MSLACFNAGDVPELIGRLSVVLSRADHKVISLPMFRRDLGVSDTSETHLNGHETLASAATGIPFLKVLWKVVQVVLTCEIVAMLKMCACGPPTKGLT